MRLGIIGLEADGIRICLNSLFSQTQFVQCDSEIGIVWGGIGIDLDRLGDQIDGAVVPADLMGDDTKQVQGVSVTRVNLQYLPIKLLGLGQMSGLMEGETLRKNLL